MIGFNGNAGMGYERDHADWLWALAIAVLPAAVTQAGEAWREALKDRREAERERCKCGEGDT